MPIGLLRNCFDYALNDNTKLGGVFDALRVRFKVEGARKVLQQVQQVYDFRNKFVAHQEQELTDGKLAERNLIAWIECLRLLAVAS